MSAHLTQVRGAPNVRIFRGGRVVGRVGVAVARPGPMVALALAMSAAILWRSFRRVEVAGTSMAPALLPGDRLVVVAVPWRVQPWPTPGAVIAVQDPAAAGRILIKRVAAVDRHLGRLEVVGDNRGASTDSRSFGPVPRSSMVGRAVYRYGPPGRSGPGPWPEEYDLA